MDDGFNVVINGTGSKFSIDLRDELNFTIPYEVCLQDIIYIPGSWGNIRDGDNWMIVVNLAKESKNDPLDPPKVLYIPVRQYHSTSDLLYHINEVLIKNYTYLCDLFYYYTSEGSQSTPRIWPQPSNISDRTLFDKQELQLRRFAVGSGTFAKPILETSTTINPHKHIAFGGGVIPPTITDMPKSRYTLGSYMELPASQRRQPAAVNTRLCIYFCRAIAVLLNIISRPGENIPVIIPGWYTLITNVNVFKNNLPIMWIYADFIHTTMLGPKKDQLLKMLPIQLDFSDVSVQSSAGLHHDYVSVQRRRIKRFEILLKDSADNGKLLDIKENIIFVLHFRPKQ